MNSNKLENCLALLIIRQAAGRRDTTILGGIFIVAFASTIALGMLDRLSARSLYLIAVMIVAFGFGYLTTWVKLEITKGSIELIKNLLLINRG